VFVAEVNGFAELTPFEVHVAGPSLAARAAGYGFPGVVVDGSDAVAVRAAVGEAVEHARRGEGPTLVEARTTRWRGHYEGDPQKYRDDEPERVDPIELLTQRLLEADVDAKRLAAIEAEIAEELDAAVQFARDSPAPSPDSLFDHVYTDA
jgi:pyruvate dehydrogenase E1 component alpha subunit